MGLFPCSLISQGVELLQLSITIPHTRDGGGNHSPKLCRNIPGIPKDLRLLTLAPLTHCRDLSGSTRGCADPSADHPPQASGSAWNVELRRDWCLGTAAEGLKGTGTSGGVVVVLGLNVTVQNHPQITPKSPCGSRGGLGLLPQLSLTLLWPQPFPALLFLLFPRS